MYRPIRVLILVVLLAGGLQGQKLSPAGDWDGVLVVGSGIELPIKLHLVSARGKTFTATVDSPSQQTMNIPVDRVELAGNILKLDITAIGGSYEGKLSGDRKTIVGTWSQNGRHYSLNFKRQQPAPVPGKARAFTAEVTDECFKNPTARKKSLRHDCERFANECN